MKDSKDRSLDSQYIKTHIVKHLKVSGKEAGFAPI